MPQMNRSTILQICLLLSAIPAQYLISQWYGADVLERLGLSERIFGLWNSFQKSYLHSDAWTERFQIVLSRAWTLCYGEAELQSGSNKESVADEDTNAYFAESKQIRSPKPATVQFNVGEVIVHRRHGYSGVIIGWDLEAKAPEEWLKNKYSPEREGFVKSPHYRILINRANKFGKSTSYIPEDEITIIKGLQVLHPELKNYFSRYDGAKYVMQEWLKLQYPHD
ncbi:F-box only protein 21-like [Ascaphus truei]|uniref:F-box only protein 21-like n=1 Tax=Ascaphus truei TaxID=8439 RepID=UPI003F596034